MCGLTFSYFQTQHPSFFESKVSFSATEKVKDFFGDLSGWKIKYLICYRD